MGANYSSNVAKSYAQATTDVINSYVEKCGTSINSNADFDINGCSGVTISNNDFSNVVLYDATCLQNIASNSTISNAIQQAIQQQASTESQNFGFPTVNDANNFVSAVTNLSTQVTNSYIETCSSNLTSDFSFKCSNSSNVVFTNNKFTNNVAQTSNCAINAQTDNGVTNSVSQSIAQSASAKEKNVFAVLFFLIIVILIFPFALGSQNVKWLIIGVIILIIVLIIVYLVIAKYRGWPPFPENKH